MKRILVIVFCLFFSGAVENTFAGPELSGKVVETMNSAGYTYVCLEKNGKKTWLAVPETKIALGQNMSFRPGSEMVNFESKTLKRKFDKIIFSAGPVAQKVNKGSMPVGSKSKVVAVTEKISVEKASGENAYIIADVYKNRNNLNNKNIVVRGKVVKVSEGILQRNWIHLQDGSGNRKKGTHNLVVTSQGLASVGDIITVRGTVYKDKDFGGGYRYDVIVENAGIKK